MKTSSVIQFLCLFLIIVFSLSVMRASEAIDSLLLEYKATSKDAFSAQVGEGLWIKEVKGRSCTTCHSSSLKQIGKHARTGKIIQPMSPSVNPERLTDVKKIKKWLLRNCKWTFKRECTAQEKGSILIWLNQQ
ncbi:MAG: cytochrome C [Gammaproteobacteria bacterium]|nr:MAG: cytochrome C [Gammaproteobacteria bacterium]